MRIAILIMVHRLPKQVALLCNCLVHNDIDIFIHIDKKVDQSIFENKISTTAINFIKNRTSTNWGGFSQVETIINCYEEILENYNYDYICNISGQDFPIKKIGTLLDHIKNNFGKEFIECRPFSLTDDWWQENTKRVHKYSFVNYNFRGRFKLEYIVNKLTGNRKADKEIIFAGNSCWFCLSYWAIVYIQSSYKHNNKLTSYFKFVWGADEIYFSTVLYNSPFKDKIIGNLLHTEWLPDDKSHPKVFTTEDKAQLEQSNKFFARKFDYTIDKEIIDYVQTLSAK